MEKSILSRMGFLTRNDKEDFAKQFAEISEEISQLKNDITNMGRCVEENQQTSVQHLSSIQKIFSEKFKLYEVKNKNFISDLQIQQTEVISIIKKSLKQQYEAILSTQKNCQKILANSQAMDQRLQNIEKNGLTKEDLDIVCGFLRLLAASQLIQEASEITKDEERHH